MLHHLLELRRRALYILVFFSSVFCIFFIKAHELFYVVISPLLDMLGNGDSLIATHITSPLLTPISLSADASVLVTAPFALHQLWRFISPGLYEQEKIQLKSAILLSLILFALGLIFCFYLVLPFMFGFFVHAIPKGVHFLPDITYTIDFITRMLLVFGLCFQVPLVCVLAVRFGLLTIELLKNARPYVIVSAFIIGMILTPPDVFSQIILAVPLCLLYELGILLSQFKFLSR